MALLAERLGVTGLACGVQRSEPNDIAMVSPEVGHLVVGRDQCDKIRVAGLACVARLPVVMARVARRHVRHIGSGNYISIDDALVAGCAFNVLHRGMLLVGESHLARQRGYGLNVLRIRMAVAARIVHLLLVA